MSGSQAQLQQSAEAAQEHLGTICEFSLNRPPMRAKIDVQSYDELKPGVQRALALVDWFDGLQQNFAAFLGEAASQGGTPSPQQLELIGSALDACVVLENQFSGWSNCINRFSWFKRTFAQVRNEVSASDPSAEQLAKDLPRLQSLIGKPEYPVGMHLTGPLRESTKKVSGHERVLLAAVFHYVKLAGTEKPDASVLRPLPYLLYLADGDTSSGAGSFNVFVGQKLQPVQKVFKRHPLADCAPPPEMMESMGLAPGHPVHLGTVLARCPHYMASMRTKWGMQKQAGEGKDCILL